MLGTNKIVVVIVRTSFYTSVAYIAVMKINSARLKNITKIIQSWIEDCNFLQNILIQSKNHWDTCLFNQDNLNIRFKPFKGAERDD